MTLMETNILTPEQEEEIRILEEDCRRIEPFGHRLFLSNRLNTHPSMNCFFRAYEGKALAGILVLFMPDPGQAEVTALVHPALRRRGVFTALLAAARRALDCSGIRTLLFCHEPVCQSGTAVLKKLPVELEHSEFLLEYSRSLAPPSAPEGLTLQLADQALIPALAAQAAAAFGDSQAHAREIAGRFFQHPAVTPYAAWLDGMLAGHLYRNTEGGETYFCGLCIAPPLQGQGLGRGLLSLALDRALEETSGPIRLEVDSGNMAAYRLYRSCGFRETAREDYYLMRGRTDDG